MLLRIDSPRPAAVHIAAGAAAAGLILLCRPAAAADTGGTVLLNMVKTYSAAKSYTGTIVTKQQGKDKDGKQFSFTRTQNIKYKYPNMVNEGVTFEGTGSVAGKIEKGNQMVVADAKTLTTYFQSQNQYITKPNKPSWNVTDLLDIMKHIPTRDQPNVKLLPADTVNGRPVNVVHISAMMPPNLTPEKQKQWKEAAKKTHPLSLYVDKQTNSLLKITEMAPFGSVVVSLENQLFNGEIPDRAFTFTPPKGAKRFVQPSPGSLPTGAPNTKPNPASPAKR